MDIENINKAESSFLFVSLFPSLIIFIYLLYLLSYVFTGIDITAIFSILGSKHYALIILMLLSYIAGMFVHGIRYVGFIWYKKLYDKKIKNFGTRLIFRLFRKGTLVEECFDRYREDNCTYEWINEVKKEKKNLIKTMWRIAAEIDSKQQVYQFYFYSELFQCCDTALLLMSIFQFIPITYLAIQHDIKVLIVNVVLIPIFIVMSIISRNIGMAFANRFIHDLDIKKNIKG